MLERHHAIGQEVSSRSSEVVHAGIYYPSKSLKARMCVDGKRLLYAYARDRGVAIRQLGKLIVATSPAEAPALEAIAGRAKANGVDDLRVLSRTTFARWNPRLLASKHFSHLRQASSTVTVSCAPWKVILRFEAARSF